MTTLRLALGARSNPGSPFRALDVPVIGRLQGFSIWPDSAGSLDQEAAPPACLELIWPPKGTPQMITIRWPARVQPALPGRTEASQAKSCESSPGIMLRHSGSVELADSESTCHVPSRSRSDRLGLHKHLAKAAPLHATSRPMPFCVGVSLSVVDLTGTIRHVELHLSPCRLDCRGERVDVVGALLAAPVDEEGGAAGHSAGGGQVDASSARPTSPGNLPEDKIGGLVEAISSAPSNS